MHFWGLLLTTALVTLDAAALELILPKLAVELEARIETASLIVTFYLFALNVVLLPAGAMADRMGVERVFSSGRVVFIIGSIGCALSPQADSLIMSRALQGVGAGIISGIGPAMIYRGTVEGERDRMFGYIGVAVALGYLVGPALGGMLFETVNWRLLFLINVPLVLLTWKWRLPKPGDGVPGAAAGTIRRGDRIGIVALLLVVSGLFWLLQPVPALPWAGWLKGGAVAMMVTGVTLIWKCNRRSDHPLIDLNLFLYNRSFACVCAGSFASYAGAFVIAFTAPFYVTSALSLNALDLGLLLTTFPAGFAGGAFFGGRLAARFGAQSAAVGAQAVIVVSVAPMIFLDAWSGAWTIAAATFGVGVARGLFVAPIASHGIQTAAVHQIGEAGAMLGLVRNLGMFVGTLCATWLLAAVLQERALVDMRAAAADELFSGFRWLFGLSLCWAIVAFVILAAPLARSRSKSALMAEGDPGF